MKWRRRGEEREELRFGTRSEAFSYMLKSQMERGADALEAAQKAGEFADLVSHNMGLPEREEIPKEGLDKYLEGLDRVARYCDEHPKTVDLLAGAATFLLGAIAGRASEGKADSPPPPSPTPIDFENLT